MEIDTTTPIAAPPHEFAALEHILLGDLRELLNGDARDPEIRRWLLAVLDVLADMLPCQVALEEHGGYLDEVREEYPEWEDTIASLLRQQFELIRRLSELRERLADDRELPAFAAGVRVDLRNWMEQYQSHHEAEANLLQSAGNLDAEITS
jgi:hypothetical protein